MTCHARFGRVRRQCEAPVTRYVACRVEEVSDGLSVENLEETAKKKIEALRKAKETLK